MQCAKGWAADFNYKRVLNRLINLRREALQRSFLQEGRLLDASVIKASQALDILIVKYMCKYRDNTK